MFKSLFSRYISVFMAIIAVSYIALASVIGFMVARYSRNFNEETVTSASRAVSATVSQRFSSSGYSDYNRYVYYDLDDIVSTLDILVRNIEGVRVYVTDYSGRLLACDSGNNAETGKVYDVTGLSFTDNISYSVTDLGSSLDGQSMTCVTKVVTDDGIVCGYVIAALNMTDAGAFTKSIIHAIVVTSLWMISAILVAVYFITERIVTPIRNISEEAKRFASGDFSERIPIKGRDEITELSVAFNNMADSLESTDKSRSTFISNVSHELRTPMTSISGFVDAMLDGAIPPESYKHYLGIISEEVKRLSRLITSLLDITRIEAGEHKFNKREFNICEIARRIIISNEKRLLNKKLDVVFECDEDTMLVYADPDAIYQVLYNLCDNAIKFSREGGKYRVRISRNNEKVFVSVFNEGAGIPHDELPLVFDRFYKADKSRGLDKSGLGLGLYICKAIINAHDEEMWVESKYGENCEFIFTLQSALAVQRDDFTK